MSKRLIISACAAAFLLSGCSYKIIEKGGLAAHKVQTLTASKFMPTQDQLEGNKTKVVVFTLDNKAPKAKTAGAGEAATGLIEQYAQESGGAEIVDRESAKKLEGELALIEMGTSKSIKGPAIADYAITGEISSVSGPKSTYWPEGKPGKMVLNAILSKATGKDIKAAPEYEHTAGIKGKIKIFQLPDGNLMRTIDIDDDKSITKMAAIGVGGLVVSGVAQPLTASEEQGLIVGATTDAVEAARHELKNFFAPRGYVIEKRVSADGKDTIFLVTFGTTNGAKEGLEVPLYTQVTSTEGRTGKEVVEESLVATVKVADIVKSNECWIHVGSKEVAEKIKQGDYVKVKFSKGVGDYAKTVGKFMF